MGRSRCSISKKNILGNLTRIPALRQSPLSEEGLARDMKWALRGYDRLTEIPLDWWCYLPGEYEPEEIAAELGLDEIPYDGFMVTTRRVADAIERMIGRPLDLDTNEYTVGNTVEHDWILAESRKHRCRSCGASLPAAFSTVQTIWTMGYPHFRRPIEHACYRNRTLVRLE